MFALENCRRLTAFFTSCLLDISDLGSMISAGLSSRRLSPADFISAAILGLEWLLAQLIGVIKTLKYQQKPEAFLPRSLCKLCVIINLNLSNFQVNIQIT